MTRDKSLSLIAKFNTLSISLVLLTAASIGAFVLYDERHNSYTILVEEGGETAAMMAQYSEYALYTENQEALRQVVESIDSHGDIVYAAIFNKQYQILVEKHRAATVHPPQPLTYAESHRGKDSQATDFENTEDGNTYTVILTPVLSRSSAQHEELFLGKEVKEPVQTLGYIQLIISHEDVRARTKTFLLSVGGFGLCIMLLGVGITFALTRRITAPLQELARITQDIAAGNLDHQIMVTTHHEIHHLATAFNRMIERLRDYRQQVESAQQLLEEKVEQRTVALQQAMERAYALAEQAE